ncbi:PREDICTED: TNF receptor-associated factor 6-like [Amphimedon queenslandica]|uniref:RING-type domain-containing protein n=1 Tax=Amphimedon queenslandica TaxID=400682 RepID=A0AAN0J854_AMPQE|nr:PREDICTED: TNF receptor-associated factor 6-like [Amphimedon queenslandica]|eukprot:XP_019852883.1 PREDICTED: TNF receptor-associated factor 6-like [Amphimedon queenslandica]
MNICTKIKSNLLLLNDDRRILDYVCPKCDNILGDPAKTSCGHWLCKGCAEELVKRNAACCVCETDLVDGDGEIQFTPDKFLREEICSLFIKCPNNKFGCGWVDTIGALSEHVSCCMHRKQECPHCNEDFAMTEVNSI